MKSFVQGRQITNPMAGIKLFNLLDNMKWSHLPAPGGIYDQHPDFIEQMRYIFSERNAWQEKEQKRKADKGKGAPTRVAGRRH